MKKFNITILIIVFIFIFIISFLVFYTDLRNSDYIYASSGVAEIKTIILDAGHGGADGGAVAFDNTQEKHINLQITLKIKSVLELSGYDVILTRTSDDSIHSKDAVTLRQKKVSDIKNREKIINNNPDAIFISIHQNKFYDKNVHGAQVFYSGNNPESTVLAQKINDSIINTVQTNNPRQIKKSGTEIYLLYNSQIPSVMVECGFLSNSDDLNKLKDDKFQKKIALSISQGIINFIEGS